MKYNHVEIAERRRDGFSWKEIAERHGVTKKQVRQAHNRWTHRAPPLDETIGGVVVQKWIRTPEGTTHVKMPDAVVDDIKAEVRQVWEDAKQDFLDATLLPPIEAPNLILPKAGMLAEIAVQDPHMGMLAYGPEVGEDQDIRTIKEDYLGTTEQLLSLSRVYAPERILYLVGNDMSHVNQAADRGKGGATKMGTMQDLDTRMSKIFRVMREVAVDGIDQAASVAPVDVVVVPGNHDPDEAFRLGEVLSAWYRNHSNVTVYNAPRKRKFYNYASNTLMLTHGEEIRRKREPLPLVMATECPDEWWVASGGRGSREIHTGHNHIRLQGGYHPTSEVDESRAIITRSLPGLCVSDAWHYEEGYMHRRAGSLLLFHPDDGFWGLHEHQPKLRRR